MEDHVPITMNMCGTGLNTGISRSCINIASVHGSNRYVNQVLKKNSTWIKNPSLETGLNSIELLNVSFKFKTSPSTSLCNFKNKGMQLCLSFFLFFLVPFSRLNNKGVQ